MRSRAARGILPIAFASVFLVVACASGPSIRHKHEYTLSPGQEFHPGLKKALLVPIDATNPEPVKGLDIANDRIMALVVSHLESHGITVEKAPHEDFGKIADAAHAKVLAERKSGASGVVSTEIEFDDIVPAILDELGEEPDLVITADILMRTAAYQGTRTIFWDGVRRRESVYDMRMSGSSLPVASLHVSVHARDGSSIFSGFGGLEQVFKIEGRGYVQREDLFEDERNLREGVCIAFYPYFGMDEYCTR